MFKACKITLFSLILCIMVIFTCNADNYVKINDLIEKSKEFNGKVVTIKAESIGEPLIRGNFSWINVNDGTNAIGIYMKNEDVQKIYKYGNYKEKGDIIEVTGIYKRNCEQHGGDVDIHADSVKILERGYIKEQPINKERRDIAFILMISTISLVSIFYRKLKI
ncbi:hypothetical protein [Clostridium sp. OS1-26]|uniref:hypothetical protein n=1 Tax=Clostridium sp. OS1-26 TaxID=3070681 RepID=UPI0027E0B4BF|nr:hypothetical protein [Clostridium sp. OS1-26]WML37899.1 hypothetical protein RCG18_07055 [Clostridium sp. OS1-26]